MERIIIPQYIKEFASVFYENGFSLYAVGGAVRDYILKKKNADWDFCTDAEPQEVKKLFKHVILTGIRHGTVTVCIKHRKFEVTTFRTDSKYSDKRHPDSVKYVKTLKEDLSRRDFTVNAIAANCLNGQIIDLFEGQKDLQRKKIRAIGQPFKRFNEDALRMLRLCRFCSKLNFRAGKRTFRSVRKLHKTILSVSKERIFDEISKTLMTTHPSVGFKLMHKSFLLKELIPSLYDCAYIKQDNKITVFEHIMKTLDESGALNCCLTIRWALLLCEIGKTACEKTCTNDNVIFTNYPHHALKSAEIADKIMSELKFSNQMRDDVGVLIANHSIQYNKNWSDKDVKHLINKVGLNRIFMLLDVLKCKKLACEDKKTNRENSLQVNSLQINSLQDIDALKIHIEKVSNQPMTLKDLAISGNTLINEGIKKGPSVGKILNQLLEMVIDYPSLNNKETLTQQAKILSEKL